MRRLVVIAAAIAAVVILIGLWATRGGPSGGKGIVFDAKVHGAQQLFTIDSDGGRVRQLTHLEVPKKNGFGAEDPAWSPDAKSIIFDSDYEGTEQARVNLFTIRPDGTKLEQVPLEIGMFTGAAAYSPDGKLISFDWDAAASGVHQQGIDIANADGSEVRRFTSLDSPTVLHHASAWSPDGKWLTFTEMHGTEEAAIVKLRLDGRGREELTRWALDANNAVWSPDGRLIAFNSHKSPLPGQSANIYVMRPDGTGLEQLTHYAGGLNAYMGDWSPDGTHIVFYLRGSDPDRPGSNQLFVMDAAGGNVRQLTHLPAGSDPGHPSWSPAG